MKGKKSVKQRKSYSEEQKAAALADLNKGMAASAVLKKHKVTTSSLYAWAKKGKQAMKPANVAAAHLNGKANGDVIIVPSNLDRAVNEMDKFVREHGVRYLKRQDLYTLLALRDAVEAG